MNEYVTAEEYYTQALTMYRNVYGEESNHKDIAEELKSVGLIKHKLTMYEEAGVFYQESLTMYRQIYGLDSNREDIALVLAILGENHRNLGDDGEAIVKYVESLLMYREVNPDHKQIHRIIKRLRRLGADVV